MPKSVETSRDSFPSTLHQQLQDAHERIRLVQQERAAEAVRYDNKF